MKGLVFLKKILSCLLCLAVLLNLSACNLFERKVSAASSQKASSAVSSSVPSSSAPSAVSAPEVVVQNGKVKVTLPAYLFSGNESFQLDGIDEKDITKNADGSYTIVLDKEKYSEKLKAYKADVQAALDEVTKNFASVKSIKANEAFTELTVTVDQSAFENSLDSFAILGVAIGALTYQAFTGVEQDKMDVLIDIKDEATGKVFFSKHYPEAFNTK